MVLTLNCKACAWNLTHRQESYQFGLSEDCFRILLRVFLIIFCKLLLVFFSNERIFFLWEVIIRSRKKSLDILIDIRHRLFFLNIVTFDCQSSVFPHLWNSHSAAVIILHIKSMVYFQFLMPQGISKIGNRKYTVPWFENCFEKDENCARLLPHSLMKLQIIIGVHQSWMYQVKWNGDICIITFFSIGAENANFREWTIPTGTPKK